MRAHVLVIAFVALVISPAASRAQARLTGADIDGTVIDQSGGAVPGCTIIVTNADTNIARTVVTDAAGRYHAPALPPGTYAVSAALAGFKTQMRDGVVLRLGQTYTLDFALVIEGASEAVTVTAPELLVSPSRTEVSSVIGLQQIEALPINGRNFIGFAVVTPGVVTDRTPLQGAVATSGLSFTGQRARSNNVMVDGLDNNDPVVGAVRATFSQEAIREFQVLVDSYSAEFGKAAGGVINIVTKSGTNEYHGNAFGYFRDRALNAKNHFDKFDIFGQPIDREKPPFTQRQWGATLGGPVRLDRTFFFGSAERTDVTDARQVSIDPTAAAVLEAAGFPVALGNVPAATENTELFGKVDHHWGQTDSTLTLRGTYADVLRDGIDDYGGIVARSRGTVQLRTDWSFSAAETDILSNRWINELRMQFADEDQQVNALDPLCGGDVQSSGCTAIDEGGPTLEVTGVAAVGRQRLTPQRRHHRRLQLLETVSYLRGAHHVKAGVEYNYVHFPAGGSILPAQFGGRYIFSPIPALGVTSALDGVRRGIPAAYVQGYGNHVFPEERYHDVSLFAQDEWKRGRVVLRPGVRYQRQFWQDVTYRLSDVGGGAISYPLAADRNNIAPRVGVSYDLTGNGSTIAHGSYGMFYDNIMMVVQNIGRVLNGTQEGIRTLVVPAPRASAAWNAPGHRLTEAEVTALNGGAPPPSLVLAPEPGLTTSYTQQASMGVDRALTSDLAISVNGVFVRGFELPGSIDYNPVLPARLGASRRPNDARCETNPAAPCVNGGIPGSSASMLEYVTFGESWYRGLTVALNKRMSRRHQFLLSYTLSKAEDSSTDFQSSFIVQNSGFGRNPADPDGLPLGFDPASERGPATHDQRHRVVLSGVYEMPWRLQLSGIFSAGSGRPFTPLAGADLNADGNGGQFPPDRARRNPADEQTSVGRNSETTASQVNVDLRVSRRFQIGSRVHVDAIVEAFNLFDRVNFVEDTNQSSFVIFGAGAFPSEPLPAYGRYTLALPPRQVQVALKLGF